MSIHGENPTAVLAVADEIDSWNAMDEIVDQVDSALAAGAGEVVIDLANVTYADSIGIDALVRADRLCRARGAALTLRSPARALLRVLGLSEHGRSLALV